MKRAEILDTAKVLVTGNRQAAHGKPEETFGKLADIWSAMLGVPITPEQAALMLAALKIARAWNNPQHDDNWIDLAGYAACGGELAEVPA